MTAPDMSKYIYIPAARRVLDGLEEDIAREFGFCTQDTMKKLHKLIAQAKKDMGS